MDTVKRNRRGELIPFLSRQDWDSVCSLHCIHPTSCSDDTYHVSTFPRFQHTPGCVCTSSVT